MDEAKVKAELRWIQGLAQDALRAHAGPSPELETVMFKCSALLESKPEGTHGFSIDEGAREWSCFFVGGPRDGHMVKADIASRPLPSIHRLSALNPSRPDETAIYERVFRGDDFAVYRFKSMALQDIVWPLDETRYAFGVKAPGTYRHSAHLWLKWVEEQALPSLKACQALGGCASNAVAPALTSMPGGER